MITCVRLAWYSTRILHILEDAHIHLNVAYLSLHYSLLAYTTSCVFYNEYMDNFDDAGCRVGACSSPFATQCICSHLTSFSNAFKVPKLRYEVNAFSIKQLNRNPVAFSFCIACILAYLVIFIYCHRKDNDDLKMVWTLCALAKNENNKDKSHSHPAWASYSIPYVQPWATNSNKKN